MAHALGALLLERGHAKEAACVFRRDLQRWPCTGPPLPESILFFQYLNCLAAPCSKTIVKREYAEHSKLLLCVSKRILCSAAGIPIRFGDSAIQPPNLVLEPRPHNLWALAGLRACLTPAAATTACLAAGGPPPRPAHSRRAANPPNSARGVLLAFLLRGEGHPLRSALPAGSA